VTFDGGLSIGLDFRYLVEDHAIEIRETDTGRPGCSLSLTENRVCVFFFSYATEDWSGFLKKFFNEFEAHVAQRLGVPKTTAGFRDQSGVQLGDDWSRALTAELRSCKAFIYVRTANYFQRDYCGREWKMFNERVESFSQRSARPEKVPGTKNRVSVTRHPVDASPREPSMPEQSALQGGWQDHAA
jgi:hypothetical protein